MLVLIGIVSLVCLIAVGGHWFAGEYEYYEDMYKRGKVVGETFEDCTHTAKYALDYSSSMATRQPVALSIKDLHRIHPTAFEYMWCCGQIQDELWAGAIGCGVIVTYIIVVSTIRRKKQSVL